MSAQEREISGGIPSKLSDFRGHIKSLDGLRGLAILLVFFYHYAGGLEHESKNRLLHALGVLFGFGWSGVDLFFVLSGFLITGILYDTRDNPHYFRNFYARRTLRIFPVYYLFLAGVFMAGTIKGVHWQTLHVSFLFYLGYPAALLSPEITHPWAGMRVSHLWSLCAEEQFYLIWPFVISWLGNARKILITCLLFFVSAFCFRAWVAHSGLDQSWGYAFLPARMDALAAGAASAILLRTTWRESLLSFGRWLALVGLIAITCISIFRHTMSHTEVTMQVVGFSFLALGYAGLLILCLKTSTLTSRLFENGLLRTFGKYSYGLYLYHLPLTVVISPLRHYFIDTLHSGWAGSVTFMIFALATNFLVAFLSFRFIESPILSLKDRFAYSGT